MTEIYFLTSGGWKFKIKLLAGLVSGETSLPGLQMTTFSLCPHMAFPLCAPGVSSSSYKDTSSVGLGLHPYDLI